jgi:hypothetical protein
MCFPLVLSRLRAIQAGAGEQRSANNRLRVQSDARTAERAQLARPQPKTANGVGVRA